MPSGKKRTWSDVCFIIRLQYVVLQAYFELLLMVFYLTLDFISHWRRLKKRSWFIQRCSKLNVANDQVTIKFFWSSSFGWAAFHNRIFVTNCPRKISMHAFALLFTITSSSLSSHHHHHHHRHPHFQYLRKALQRLMYGAYQNCKQPYLIFPLQIPPLIKLQKLAEWNWKGFTAAAPTSDVRLRSRERAVVLAIYNISSLSLINALSSPPPLAKFLSSIFWW